MRVQLLQLCCHYGSAVLKSVRVVLKSIHGSLVKGACVRAVLKGVCVRAVLKGRNPGVRAVLKGRNPGVRASRVKGVCVR